MNKLQEQCKELRDLATDADVYGDTRYFCDPLEQAADTIWQLRDDLQQANAENAKLRKENDTLCRRIDELCMEVESLRRTAKRIVHCDGSVGHCACSACGGAIDQDDAFCRHCGAEFKGDA